jgi:TPR repeat protein
MGNSCAAAGAGDYALARIGVRRRRSGVGRRLYARFRGFWTLGAWGEVRRELHELHQAAAHGNAQAQHRLGTCYCFGRGVGQDQRKAVAWFRKAAERGEPEAQYSLGVSYYKGQGVGQDLREAAKWLHAAAQQGHANAQVVLKMIVQSRPEIWERQREYLP